MIHILWAMNNYVIFQDISVLFTLFGSHRMVNCTHLEAKMEQFDCGKTMSEQIMVFGDVLTPMTTKSTLLLHRPKLGKDRYYYVIIMT